MGSFLAGGKTDIASFHERIGLIPKMKRSRAFEYIEVLFL
jgi:hypothetical protein